jgi:hypothetical protein
MGRPGAVLLVAVLLAACMDGCGSSQPADLHFSVEISSPQQEAAYVCTLIQQVGYFRERGYMPELPDHVSVDALLQKAIHGTIREEDCAPLLTLFEGELYDERAYRRAERTVARALPRVEPVYEVFLSYRDKWGFHVPEHYRVLLTLYGPGGMFDPERGIIWLMITDAGSFKMNDDPAYAIIHEATHIGIDGPVVQRFELPQPMIERIVDRFVVDHFADILPEYQLQRLGDPAIDALLDHPDSWERLPEYVGTFVGVRPGSP